MAKTQGGRTQGVKTERIRSNNSETIFVSIFFPYSESEQIVCGYEYEIGAYRLRIRTEYRANTVWLWINILSDLSLKIKIGLTSGVLLACKNSSTNRE
jgi:hypothetical protein